MTSTENTKKNESNGEDEFEERQEDGRNGADFRGLNGERWLVKQKNNLNEARSGSSPSLPKEM